MKVINTSGVARYIPAANVVVEAGEEVDLPAEHAKSLVQQGWEKPKPKKEEDPTPDKEI